MSAGTGGLCGFDMQVEQLLVLLGGEDAKGTSSGWSGKGRESDATRRSWLCSGECILSTFTDWQDRLRMEGLEAVERAIR